MSDEPALVVATAESTTLATPNHACEATLDRIMDGEYHQVPRFASELLAYFQEDMHKDKAEFCQAIGEKASRLMYRAKRLGDEKEAKSRAQQGNPVVRDACLVGSGYILANPTGWSVGLAYIAQHTVGDSAGFLESALVLAVYAWTRDVSLVVWHLGLWCATLWCVRRSKMKTE